MNSNTSRGFNLVELVLTLVILGVIAAIAIPKFFNQTTFEERFFYDDVLAASRYASKLALSSGCSVRMSINAGGYSLAQDSNCDFTSPNFSINVQRPNDDEDFSNTDVPSGLTITASQTTLVFRPDHLVVNGSGSSFSTATIQLAGEINRLITIYEDSGHAVGI